MISLDDILTGAETVGIAGHIKPDADAFGSCMGLYLFLKQYYPSIKASVYLEDTYSESYEFVQCSDEIIHSYPSVPGHDVFFSLDCSDPPRLGKALSYFNAAKTRVVIDHHVSNPGFGMINEIQPDASSTSELIALLIGKDRVGRTIAEPLYMGIAHDTGIFKYSCTSSRTMATAGWLMDTGIEFSKICDDTFYKKSFHQTQITGKALAQSDLMLGGRMIYTVVTRKDIEFYQVSLHELDGIVPELRVTDGVEIAVFLYEVTPGEFKASLRSNGKVDVAAIAVHFGGGGHRMAAGCSFRADAYKAALLIADEAEKQLKETYAERDSERL